MTSLANGDLPTRLGFHELNTERGARTGTSTGWADPTRLTGLDPFSAGSSPFFSPRLILTFCTWPPHLCHFELVIHAIKIGDLYV
jgi:hypothetical protein